jgi:hypothetical protein
MPLGDIENKYGFDMRVSALAIDGIAFGNWTHIPRPSAELISAYPVRICFSASVQRQMRHTRAEHVGGNPGA